MVGQHGGIPVRGLICLPVGDLLVTEPDEHPFSETGGPVLKNGADRRFGGRQREQPGQCAAQDHRGIHHHRRQPSRQIEQPHRMRGPVSLVGYRPGSFSTRAAGAVVQRAPPAQWFNARRRRSGSTRAAGAVVQHAPPAQWFNAPRRRSGSTCAAGAVVQHAPPAQWFNALSTSCTTTNRSSAAWFTYPWSTSPRSQRSNPS